MVIYIYIIFISLFKEHLDFTKWIIRSDRLIILVPFDPNLALDTVLMDVSALTSATPGRPLNPLGAWRPS